MRNTVRKTLLSAALLGAAGLGAGCAPAFADVTACQFIQGGLTLGCSTVPAPPIVPLGVDAGNELTPTGPGEVQRTDAFVCVIATVPPPCVSAPGLPILFTVAAGQT